MASRQHPLRRFDPPQPPAPKPRRWAAVFGVGAAAALATGIYYSQPIAEHWLLQRWTATVEHYSAEEASAAMKRAAENGPWGRRLLVAALDSPNDESRLAAVAALKAAVEDWKQDAAVDHSADVVDLAHHLAESSPRWSPLHSAALEPLIVSLANWRLAARSPGLLQFTADCETLVRLLQDRQPTRLAVVPREVIIPPPVMAPPIEPPPPEQPPLPRIGGEDPPAIQPPGSPSVSSRRTPTPPTSPSEDASPELMLELLPEPGGLRRIDPPREQRRQIKPRATSASLEMTKLTDWEVITLLHAENTVQTTAAEEELTHRGYRRPDLAIARLAADPNPAVRRKLAEELPRQTAVDARRWLKQLAQDEDGGVRAVAQGILKTARDPALSP